MSLLLSYYGDDFTGSTDVMEALAIHGVETVLFTREPNEAQQRAFADFQAVGLAGSSRSRSPQWMEENLPPAYRWLKSLGARFCHYKVCSTFDSSPAIGNIGKAIELALREFKQESVPLIVGAPQLKRFTFAGHLFAAYQGETFRIDRHPVMSRHPVTPMHESDLLVHLAKQADVPARMIDVFDAHSQLAAGEALLSLPERSLPFLAGSSGIEYALMKALAARGEISGTASFAPIKPYDRMLVVSGSVSPTTERQIRNAITAGFEDIATDPVSLATAPQEMDRVLARASAALEQGKSPLIYTAMGPSTDQGRTLDAIPEARHAIGRALGGIARQCIARHSLKRVVIAGGDSSSHALGELDIHALTVRKPLPQSPGSPMCEAHSSAPELSGLEIAMKGGQLGSDDYFAALRNGG